MIFDILFLALLIYISVNDVRHKMIPNSLVIAVFILALLAGAFKVYSGFTSVAELILGFLIVSIPMLIFYGRGKIGGGDVKLMAAIGLYLGYTNTVAAFFIACISALLAALILRIPIKSKMPLAPFFTVGSMIVILLEFIGERF